MKYREPGAGSREPIGTMARRPMNDAASRAQVCHNCGALLHGRFCADCGQEARPLDPPLSAVVRDLAHEFFDVDGRLLRSVRQLFLAPGFLTKELFLGRRAPWVTPLRLYLIFSVAYFAVVALGGTSITVRVKTDGARAPAAEPQRPSAKTAGERETATELERLGFTNEEELRATVSQVQAVWMPRVNFVLVPLFAALVALVRRSSGRRYPQHLLFALHAHAAWFGVRTLAAAGALVPVEIVGDVLNGLTTIYGIVYVVIALRLAYDIPTRRAIRDAAIVLGVYGVCVVAATAGVILPALFWHTQRAGAAPAARLPALSQGVDAADEAAGDAAHGAAGEGARDRARRFGLVVVELPHVVAFHDRERHAIAPGHARTGDRGHPLVAGDDADEVQRVGAADDGERARGGRAPHLAHLLDRVRPRELLARHAGDEPPAANLAARLQPPEDGDELAPRHPRRLARQQPAKDHAVAFEQGPRLELDDGVARRLRLSGAAQQRPPAGRRTR